MEVPRNHPIRRAVAVLRAWLVLVVSVMVWNALVANPILLTGWLRPLPFFFLAAVALWWSGRTWHMHSVIVCCSLISVGVFLRAVEVLLFADNYDIRARLTGVSLWLTLGGTTIAFGILNVLAVSRREAEEHVWSSGH